MIKKQVITLISLFLFSATTYAGISADVLALQNGWAKANYELKDDAQIESFEELIKQAEAVAQHYPDAAESWIWLGIIQSTYAGKAGPFDAMSYANAAKTSLENAIKINDTALDGSAYTSLGTLYFKVPGWPIGFGDDDKAKDLLEKAVEINPGGIDANYFYADFLMNQDDYDEARQHLLKAKAAPARPARPLADKGRKHEIVAMLHEVDEELDLRAKEMEEDD